MNEYIIGFQRHKQPYR